MKMKLEQKSQDNLITREATLEDDHGLRALIAVPMTTRGVQISFQREPSYFKASDILYRHKLHVVIEDKEHQKKVACYSNGYRPCYINQQVKDLRYASDLRVDSNYRGKSLVKVLAVHLKTNMHDPNFSQMIIFDDNHAARAAMQTSKTGMPDYYDEGLIETLTLTYLAKKRKINAFIKSTAPDYQDNRQVQSCVAQKEHIQSMNDFIKEMSEHYNFIPAYNFEELAQEHPYYSGIKLSDFVLYFQHKKLTGMFGLWNQHRIKQTKILHYSPFIAVLRPIYNLINSITKGMPLPKLGDSLKYHVLHSLLCHPNNLALHNLMLGDAYKLSKRQGVGVVSFTLSHKDPRYQLNQFYKGERLTGMHGFISYACDPRSNFDDKLIPYLEVGRI